LADLATLYNLEKMNVNSRTLSDIAPTLADLKKFPMEQKCRLLLARLAKIGEHDSALNKHNLMMPGDPYALAYGYPDAEKTPVREHLLGAPWTRLVNEGYLVDLTGQGFYKVTQEGKEYLAQEELPAPSPTSPKIPTATTGVPRAFLSYSWDGRDHQLWVTKFAERLQGESGVEIIFDGWHLKPGDDKLHFMEQAVAESDFVVVVCTPTYAERANRRQGGVGYESMVITSELAEHILTNKFIPVLRKGTWDSSLPIYLRSRMGVNLSEEPYQEDEYEKLLRVLHGEPIQPPHLASKPVFAKKLDALEFQKPIGLSLKAVIQHRRLSIPGGPADGEELYELMVGIQNDGDKDATDFRLDVEIPTGFVDGGGYIIEKRAARPGVRLFQVSHSDRKVEHLYPGTTIDNLVTVNCVIWGKVEREHPELLQEKITATVYSGSMTPSASTKTFSELRK
jgi:TIR domain